MTPAITKTLQRIKTKFHNFAELLEAFTQQQRLLSMEDTAPIETPEHNPVAKPNPFWFFKKRNRHRWLYLYYCTCLEHSKQIRFLVSWSAFMSPSTIIWGPTLTFTTSPCPCILLSLSMMARCFLQWNMQHKSFITKFCVYF